MNALPRLAGVTALMVMSLLATTGCTSMHHTASSSQMRTVSLALSGKHEVPPVTSGASGTGAIQVASDRSVTGKVTVNGMQPTAAHIHAGAPGVNGPVVIPLVKTTDNVFAVPPNTKFTDEQHAAYKAGNLYVNVHSATYPAGEVRAQLVAK